MKQLPVLTSEQKLTYREMQLEVAQLKMHAQEVQFWLTTVSQRMSQFIADLAGESTGVSFDSNTLTFVPTPPDEN